MLYREYGISDIVSVGKQEMKVSVFPNPVVDYLYIKDYQNVNGCTLYKMDGSILLKQSGNVEKINMSSYPRGSYVLRTGRFGNNGIS